MNAAGSIANMSVRTMSKTEFEVLAAFRYQLRRFLRFSEELTRRHGVTPLQYQLMLQVQGFPGRDWATVAELAERLQAKHHGVVALVSRCEAAGLVRRGASRDDQRRVEVHLSAAGRQCLQRLARLHRDELRSLASGFVVPGLADVASALATRSAPRPR
jgi:DNA-binding MarR family transcriptional regulator